jgi:hypothetical protein
MINAELDLNNIRFTPMNRHRQRHLLRLRWVRSLQGGECLVWDPTETWGLTSF